MEFSLNVFSEFSDKNNINLKRNAVLKTTISCVRLYHSATETQLTEKTFKLILVHASVIFQILWIRWIQWKFLYI